MSIFGLLYGLDLLNILWSIVTMCAYHVGNGIFQGDFSYHLSVEIFEIFNMTFHHV